MKHQMGWKEVNHYEATPTWVPALLFAVVAIGFLLVFRIEYLAGIY